MIQHKDGTWSEKIASEWNTILHTEGTPDTISWDRYMGSGETMTAKYYNSNIIYFAVSAGPVR